MRPVDAPHHPPVALALLADAAALTLSSALAWGVRIPDASMATFGAMWSSSVVWIVPPQWVLLAAVSVVSRLRGRTAVVCGAILAGGALGWFAAYANSVVIPRGLVVGDVWLSMVLALAWRSAWWLSRRTAALTREANLDDLVAPGTSPGVWLAITRHRTLLQLLVARDLKLKYRGSLVGFFWSLANPIVMTGTYTLAFTYIFQVRAQGFIFLLLIAILAWTFFSASAGMATGAIVDSGSLVRSVYFPRLILPVATVSFNFIQYVLALAVLLPFMFLFYRLVPGWSLLALPLLLALLALFTLGVALLMAAATAAYRDVRHLLDITLQVLFWATPIMYSRATLPAGVSAEIGGLMMLSPLAPFIEIARGLIYYGDWSAPVVWCLAVVYAGCALLMGLTVFLRHEERFAE